MGLDILMDHLCGDRVKKNGVEIILTRYIVTTFN